MLSFSTSDVERVDTSVLNKYSGVMALRLTPLITNEHYHIFNRGVARQPTFFQKRDYERFILSMEYNRFENIPYKLSRYLHMPAKDRFTILENLVTQSNTIVEIVSYCLMPNHFHLLLKQTKNNGISIFMKRISDGYTKYINTKYDRVGPLFQGAFKNVYIETDEQLIHLSRYIHLNPVISNIIEVESLLQYHWSSLTEYITNKYRFINPDIILSYFPKQEEYKHFVYDQINYAKELEKIKHLLIE